METPNVGENLSAYSVFYNFKLNRFNYSVFSCQGLRVIDFGQPDYMKTLEYAIQHGKPVLLQNILETLEPALNPVLNKSLVVQQGQLVLRMNEKFIPYHEKFRFFITTKMPNPHYAPEVWKNIYKMKF